MQQPDLLAWYFYGDLAIIKTRQSRTRLKAVFFITWDWFLATKNKLRWLNGMTWDWFAAVSKIWNCEMWKVKCRMNNVEQQRLVNMSDYVTATIPHFTKCHTWTAQWWNGEMQKAFLCAVHIDLILICSLILWQLMKNVTNESYLSVSCCYR